MHTSWLHVQYECRDPIPTQLGPLVLVGRGKTVPERVWSLGMDNATSLSAGVPALHPSCCGWRLKKTGSVSHHMVLLWEKTTSPEGD